MRDKYYVTYWLPDNEYVSIFELSSTNFLDAQLEVENALDSLRFFGAYDIHICNSHGLIIYRF